MQFRPAHLLLASKFLRPRTPGYFTDASDPSGRRDTGWTAALGEPPALAITYLLDEGYLVRCAGLSGSELNSAFERTCTVAEIRSLLQERHLKVSGRKAKLIERLAQESLETIRRVLKDRELVQCSASGKLLAQRWTTSVTKLQADLREAIEQKEFDHAVRFRIAFDEELGFPKWEFAGLPEATQLVRITQASPAILRNVSPATLESLRFSAALWYVCREYFAPLSVEPIEGSRLLTDAATRMVLFSASWQRNMEQFKTAGVRHVQHSAVVKDLSTCEKCRQLHGRKYSVDEAPELPHQECENGTLGCRCSYQGIFSSDA